MLGFKDKPDEKIKKGLEAKRRQLMVDRVPRLQHLTNSPGWADYVALLDDYLDACKKRKAITALDRADDKTIYELKLLDHEIFILSWVKDMPAQFIDKVGKMKEKDDG